MTFDVIKRLRERERANGPTAQQERYSNETRLLCGVNKRHRCSRWSKMTFLLAMSTFLSALTSGVLVRVSCEMRRHQCWSSDRRLERPLLMKIELTSLSRIRRTTHQSQVDRRWGTVTLLFTFKWRVTFAKVIFATTTRSYRTHRAEVLVCLRVMLGTLGWEREPYRYHQMRTTASTFEFFSLASISSHQHMYFSLKRSRLTIFLTTSIMMILTHSNNDVMQSIARWRRRWPLVVLFHFRFYRLDGRTEVRLSLSLSRRIYIPWWSIEASRFDTISIVISSGRRTRKEWILTWYSYSIKQRWKIAGSFLFSHPRIVIVSVCVSHVCDWSAIMGIEVI